jgi:hypothetical protein
MDRNYSLKVEMLDYSQRLFEFDEAIRFFTLGLCRRLTVFIFIFENIVEEERN